MRKLNTVFEINTNIFWRKMENTVREYYHPHCPIHLKEMFKLLKHLGVDYVTTFYADDANSHFRFKIVNKKKFLFTKLKYGF